MAEPVLVRVVAPHFVAGLVLERRFGVLRCVHAAPILRRYIGWPFAEVSARLARYELEEVPVNKAEMVQTLIDQYTTERGLQDGHPLERKFVELLGAHRELDDERLARTLMDEATTCHAVRATEYVVESTARVAQLLQQDVQKILDALADNEMYYGEELKARFEETLAKLVAMQGSNQGPC